MLLTCKENYLRHTYYLQKFEFFKLKVVHIFVRIKMCAKKITIFDNQCKNMTNNILLLENIKSKCPTSVLTNLS